MLIETDIDILCPAQSAILNPNPSIDEEIKALTIHVQDCVEKLLSTLNARASLLLKAERPDLAFHDADAMMVIAPYSPLGFLHAGDIFSLRGQHVSAIEIYDDGLKRVPRSHPEYQQLVKAREAVKDQKDTRIDFISKLPLDVVVHNIIPRILERRSEFRLGWLLDCFHVSRTWRQRLALANGMHYFVGPEDVTAKSFEDASDLAPFMRSLTVIQPYNEFLSKITRPRRKFRMLKKLHIYESTARGPSSLLSSLRSLGKTLTELEIEYGYYTYKEPKTLYRLCDFVDACPHLLSIRVDGADIDMSSVAKTYPKLIKLELRNRETAVNGSNISSLLRPFPKLQALKLVPVSGSEILPAIDQHCSSLQQLVLTNDPVQSTDTLDLSEKTTGLRALIVPSTRSFGVFKEDDMVQYLMKHSETIETFNVTENMRFHAQNGLLNQTASQQVTFKQLRRISYHPGAGDGLTSFILWMMQRAPHLEYVGTIWGGRKQQGRGLEGEARIMQEITQPQYGNLKRLGMRPRSSVSEEEERLIQHHLDFGEQSNLTEMEIDVEMGAYDTLPLLSMIGRLSQLTTLELFSRGSLPRDSWGETIRTLANGCPALEQFTVRTNGEDAVAFQDLNGLKSHPNLKHIVIHAHSMHGDASTFCKTFKNLESLHLHLLIYQSEIIQCLDKAPFKFILTKNKRKSLICDHYARF